MRNPIPAGALPVFVLALALAASAALATPPVISNLQVQQRPFSNLVEMTFDLADDGDGYILVVPMFSSDGGATYAVRCDSLSGDWYTHAGPGKTIVWEPRGQLPDFQSDACRIRLFALDGNRFPGLQFFRLEGETPVPLAQGVPDTVGYGQPYAFMWAGTTGLLEGLDPAVVAEMDTIAPLDDGLYGFKWRSPAEECLPELQDCWHPRRFNEATGDSFSYYAPVQSLTLANDNTGTGVLQRRLPSGVTSFQVTTRDLILDELSPYQGQFDLVVNYDPHTLLLNGQQDWAHPEDPEVYPYYILLEDPSQTHHPFTHGDRIPDRTYVVFKGLFRDDPRDAILDPMQPVGSVAVVEGVRTNYTGGIYSFSTGASPVDEAPDWPAGVDGWAADTLGFLTGPSTEFTFTMKAVDEHGRRDGTPPELRFSVGYPPCVQCVEVLPGGDGVSAFTPDLECFTGQAGHACLGGDPVELFIAGSGASQAPGRDYLLPVGQVYLAIEKLSLQTQIMDTEPDPERFHVIPCYRYQYSILLHGRDDPREAWADPRSRTMAWHYQVDYACDPHNAIADGQGQDYLGWPTWGAQGLDDDLEIDPVTGVWRLKVAVDLPRDLVNSGATTFRAVLTYIHAGGDAELADTLFNICTRQLGDAQVRAMSLDQTLCGYLPARPARYHLFHAVRPSDEPTPGSTWRDCNPTFTGVSASLELGHGAMASHEPDQAVRVPFRIVLDEATGDLTCDPDGLKGQPAQQAWYAGEQ